MYHNLLQIFFKIMYQIVMFKNKNPNLANNNPNYDFENKSPNHLDAILQ